jgi:hypothetical protein
LPPRGTFGVNVLCDGLHIMKVIIALLSLVSLEIGGSAEDCHDKDCLQFGASNGAEAQHAIHQCEI